MAMSIYHQIRFRRDLICQPLHLGSRDCWVLKDPFSRQLHYVENDEYEILKLVDGRRTPQQIYHECRKQFATTTLSPNDLGQFLADAKNRRLIEAPPSDECDELQPKSHKTASRQNLLAFRLPGIRPQSIIRAISSIIPTRFTTQLWIAYATLVTTAASIAIIHWPTISAGLMDTIATQTSQTWLMFFVVVATIKIVHELAHAVACNLLGGDCREMGIMILFGFPCLYCDVSDAWLMRERWKRIVVSAAGIIAELGIAAIATLLWVYTTDPALRQWCLLIMVTCSANTVLINGNPLMRYDGYFILSDILGVPNLASRASEALHHLVRHWVWCEEPPTQDETRIRWLPIYAILSGCYRLFVLLSIAAIFYQFTSSASTSIIGLLFFLIVVKSLVTTISKSLFKPSKTLLESKSYLPILTRWSTLSICIALILFIPLPQRVTAPMTIRAANSQDIYLGVGAKLVESVTESTQLMKGDPIAMFENLDLRQMLVEAQSQESRFASEEAALQRLRSSSPDIASQLLATQTLQKGAHDKVALMTGEFEKLIVSSPIDGRVFFPTPRSVSQDEGDANSWSGTPLDATNCGAWIEAGTWLCTVGDPIKREAILLVNQQDASLIAIGQRVRLNLPSGAEDELWGTVTEVSTTPVMECPSELLTTGLVASHSTSSVVENPKPNDTLYQVRVKMNNGTIALPVRTTGTACIKVNHSSIWTRCSRLLLQSFRF